MKYLLFFLVTFFIGLSQGKHIEENPHEHVLKRFTRQSSDLYMIQLEAILRRECQVNNHEELQDELQSNISELKTCLKEEKIFMVTKEEYLNHLEACSRNTIKTTKKCLNSKQRYFPDLLLQLAKSLVSFLYDDITTLPELGKCQRNLSAYRAQVKYHQCLLTASRNTNDQQSVPENQEDFCRSFLAALECFPEHLKEFCADTESMRKFTRDYVNALRGPCGFKESPDLN